MEIPVQIRSIASVVSRGRTGWVTAGLEITKFCNLHCPHCYGDYAPSGEDIPEGVVVGMAQRLSKLVGVLFVIGGEPMQVPHIVERVTRLMRMSVLVTNGTRPYQFFTRTIIYQSIDGTEKTHDDIRRNHLGLVVGSHRRAVKHILDAQVEARRRGLKCMPVYIHVTVHKRNYRELEEMTRFWHELGAVVGIIFSKTTDAKLTDSGIVLDDAETRKVVATLLRLKRQYGDFIWNTKGMIKNIAPEKTRDLSPDKCFAAKMAPTFAGNGDGELHRKHPCVFGEDPNCASCGVISRVSVHTLLGWSRPWASFAAARALLKMYRMKLPSVIPPLPEAK
jgi:MoaA/NifB/PqqE/SkfB family radical SAM enzyme